MAARWAAALPTLLATLPQGGTAELPELPPANGAELPELSPAEGTALAPAGAAAAPADPVPAGPTAFDRAAWLRGWLTRRARPLPPEAATRYHLLLTRAAAHAAETAALATA